MTRTFRYLLLALSFGLLLCAAYLLVTPLHTFAKSTTWSQTFAGTTWHSVPSWDSNLPLSSQTNTGDTMHDPHIEVTYLATIENSATGEVIPPNGCIPQGTDLTLSFTPHQSSHVYWFGTGYSYSSPYGEWNASAAPGPIACDLKDQVFDIPHEATFYIPFVVNPPQNKTITNTGGLSCGAPAADGSLHCTASSVGNTTPAFNFSDTYGYYYYRFDNPNNTLGCQGFNTPLSTTYGSSAQTGGTQIVIPAQSISYPLCISPATSAPNPPTVTVTPQSCPDYSITLQATDPDGDRIRYGIDWDNDGSINEWVPATGYVASGQTQTVIHTFADSTTQNFTVYTQDQGGMLSVATVQSVTVPSCPRPPTVVLAADETSLTFGDSTTLRWQASANARTCVGTGFSTGGAIAGAVSIRPPQTTTYSVQCTNAVGSASDSEVVSVKPVIVKCDAVGRDAGDISLFSATADGGKTPYTLWEWSGSDGAVGTTVSRWTNRSEDFNWTYATPGTKTMRVRVQDSASVWSDWYQCPNSTVNPTPAPDLMSYRQVVVGNPASSPTNVALTIHASAHNNVWVSVPGPFSDVFSYSTNAGITWIPISTPPPITNLAGHGDVDESTTFTPIAPGSYIFRHCVDIPANAITESDENNNCSQTSAVTVTGPTLPDLISQNLTIVGGITSVPINTVVSFTATVKNNSVTAVGSPFSDIFEYSFGGGAWIPMAIPPSVASLGANGTLSETGSFNPQTAGTYNIRHCADMPGNAVAESDETNNCSTAVTLIVTATVAYPVVGSCSVTPNPVDINTPATWSASASGGTTPYSYRFSGEAMTPLWSTQNSVTASYPTSGIKTATIEVQDGLGMSSGPVDCATLATTLTVTTPPNAPTALLEARNVTTGGAWSSADITITAGDQVQLRWSSTNATACTKDFVSGSATDDSTGVDITEPAVGSPTTFTLSCTGQGGTATDNLQVSAVAGGNTPTLTVTPTRVASGGTVSLTADTNGHPDCTLAGTGIGSLTITGPYTNPSVGPIVGQTDYTLSCPDYNSGAPITATVRIQPIFIEE